MLQSSANEQKKKSSYVIQVRQYAKKSKLIDGSALPPSGRIKGQML